MKTQKTVLVIEDEKSLRDAVVDILRIKGIVPLVAKNGREGMNIALSMHPDLILLDLIMPEMDGMTTFANIRADAWGANVPIMILTNLSETDAHGPSDAAANGPTSYLVKSDWKIHDIADKMEKLLEGR